MIRSWRDRESKKVWDRLFSRKFQSVSHPARKRLLLLDAAVRLSDLSLPGLNLEPLRGDRKGQHSIRINDQYRVCFVWTPEGPSEVEITDYH